MNIFFDAPKKAFLVIEADKVEFQDFKVLDAAQGDSIISSHKHSEDKFIITSLLAKEKKLCFGSIEFGQGSRVKANQKQCFPLKDQIEESDLICKEKACFNKKKVFQDIRMKLVYLL